MAVQGAEVQLDRQTNACCEELQKKHSKLWNKYSKLEKVKNEFRECATVVQNKYDALEKDYGSLKKELEELKVQANVWKDEKDEKDKEAGSRIDLKDEAFDLKDEVLAPQDEFSASQGAAENLQERIIQAEEEIKQLKELLDQERGKAKSEKKNAEMEKKKAVDALKKLEKEMNKVSGAQKAANAEKKKAEENRLMWEKLKKETDDMKSAMALEKCKYEDAEKKVEAEKQNTIRERKRVEEQKKLAERSLKEAKAEKDRANDLNRKLDQARNRVEQLEGELSKYKSSNKSEDRLLLEKLKKEIDDLNSLLAQEKSKSAAAHKKMEVERQKVIGERKRADLASVKSKEQKEQADDLNRKSKEERNRAEKLELELRKYISSEKSVEVLADKSNTGGNAVSASDVYMAMLKNDTPFSQWVEKMLLEKEQNNIKEKRRADSEKKKAKKQREAAEEYKKMAMEQKKSANQLSGQLQEYKLRVEDLQKELQESVSCRIYASNSPTRNNDVFSETDTVRLLKKQLKLEKLLAKHAKEATKVETFRNKILQKELCHLKQEFLQLQERLNILDKNFLHGTEGIYQLQKIGGPTSKSEILDSDGQHRRLLSGIDSRMDPPYRGSNQKMLQSSAINSSSASFSDRPLVGSQERGTVSIMTSANLGEDASNFTKKMSDKMGIAYTEHNGAKADNRKIIAIKDYSNKRKLGSCEKKRNAGAVNSIENLYAEGDSMHQHLPQRLSQWHDILKGQMDEPEEGSLRETSCRKLFRPLKKRKISSEGTVESSGMPDSDINNSNACMPSSSPGSDAMRSDLGFEDGMNNGAGQNLCIPQDFDPQDFDHLVTDDYRKLLDMDNAADEDSYLRAIGSPLSPMLPEVEYHDSERLEVGRTEILVNKSFQEELSNARDHLVTIEAENNFTNVVSNGSSPSQLPMEDNSDDFSKDTTLLEATDTHCQEIHVSSVKFGMPSDSGNEGTIESCQNCISCSHSGIHKCFIVASDNKDKSSILRILQTICSFKPQCTFDHSVEIFIQNIIHTLSKAEDLSTREKTCVLLSLILHEISELGTKNTKDDLGDNFVHALGSVNMKFNSALSDPALKRMFIESCDLFELFALIEDFLLQRKVFVYGAGVSAESESQFTSKLDLILNGIPIILLEVDASANLVVTGGSLLASLCSAVDHVGFVCEMSCNIIRMQKLDPPVLLAILHVFAHICGSKYFTLPQYSTAMAVVKSLVIFLEKQTLSSDSTSISLSNIGNPSGNLLCTDCPFSAGTVSVEEVAAMLSGSFQKQCHSESQLQDSLALVNLLVPRLHPHERGTKEIPDSGEAVLLSSKCDENLFDFLDILSLVEVLASVMCWNWTSNHLVTGICEYLELNLMKGVSAAAIILLGQIGRLGVDASGYEDFVVEKIRGCLSRIACGSIFKKLSLAVQFAVITSLCDVTPIKLEEMSEGKIETAEAWSECISSSSSVIKEWFSSLNQKQQSSFSRLRLDTANEVNSAC